MLLEVFGYDLILILLTEGSAIGLLVVAFGFQVNQDSKAVETTTPLGQILFIGSYFYMNSYSLWFSLTLLTNANFHR